MLDSGARLNILFCIPSLNQGGTERQLSLLAPSLASRGHMVTVVLRNTGGQYERTLLDAGVTLKYVDPNLAKLLGYNIAYFIALFRASRQVQYSIKYGFGRAANLMLSILKPLSRGSVVWGVRHSGSAVGFVERMLLRVTPKFVNALIANSESGCRLYLSAGFPKDKAYVIHNGIDTAAYKIDDCARRLTRSQLGIPDDVFLISIVGRLAAIKGHEIFLRAAARLNLHGRKTKFLVVGGGSEDREKALRQLALSLGLLSDVIWVGSVTNVQDYMNASDIVISASYSEGFSNVIAEALATGTPCVATDVGDSAAIVDGSQWVVEAGDFVGMANAIAAYLPEAAKLDRLQLRQNIVDRYSIAQMTEKTETILRSLAE